MCSECGLDLEWAKVLREQGVPTWSFEHAITRRRARFFQTIQMTFRPTTLWRGMDLSFRIRWLRLSLLLVIGVTLLHALVGAFVFVACAIDPSIQWPLYRRGWMGPISFFDWWSAAFTAVFPYQSHRGSWGAIPVHPAALHLLLTASLMALAFQALPVTLRRAKVRQRHVSRVWMYSLIPVPALLAAWGAGIWPVHRLHSRLWLPVGSTLAWRPSPFLAALHWLQNHDGAILTVAATAWLWWWWSMSCHHYLKVPQARMVSAIMLLMAGIAGATLVTLVPGLTEAWFL